MQRALILFAHGARDPEWARPVQAVARRLREQLPDVPVSVAFLEFMDPGLEAAIAALCAAQGSQNPNANSNPLAVDILPFFIAQGGHLREDVPRLLEAISTRHPEIRLRLLPPLGELPAVQAAMAMAISQLLGSAD